jgi:hypothetical protein
MTPRYFPHFTLPEVHRQPVAVAFDAPDIVTDTGLLRRAARGNLPAAGLDCDVVLGKRR